MKKKYIFCIGLLLLCTHSFSQSKQKVDISTQNVLLNHVVEKVLHKGLTSMDLGLYPGSLLLHGMSEYAVQKKDPKQLNQAIRLYLDFKSKKIEGRGSFISYAAGGSGAAYLDFLSKTNLLSEQVLRHAEKMYKEQKRSSEGIITANWAKDSLDQVFIDIAFAVTPYMLYTGLKYKREEFVDIAVFETLELFKILKDSNGLLHQGRGFQGKGVISQDNWSRGNGWGAYALAILVRDLPNTHPRKKEVVELAKAFFTSVLKYQNSEGLWHQEMTDKTSFVETSGSGLLLYSLGIAIEKGVISKTKMDNFLKGLRAYTSYIAEDGSISNTSYGCLCPRRGFKEDYKNHTWIYNDPHAFGPVVLAFSQAIKMGITTISPLKEIGCYAKNDTLDLTPRTTVKYMPERKQEIIWENDRIAFRFYGPPARNEVSSGIDVWAKSVVYPIMEKWYRQNDRGQSYHIDHGEGADFYHVGFARGCGGTAIWYKNKPYTSSTYSYHSIIKNTNEEIIFELEFEPWQIEGFKVAEVKTITMKKGSDFFEVKSVFKTDYKGLLTIAIGLSSYGNPEVIQDKVKGTLTLWEKYSPDFGDLGTSVILSPDKLKGFTSHDKDHFILTDVNSGQILTYYVGAGWSKGRHFKSKEDWIKYVSEFLKN